MFNEFPAKLRKVAAKDPTRYGLRSIHVREDQWAVATDGHRLHMLRTKIAPGTYQRDGRAPEPFPNVNRVIPPQEKTAIVEAEALRAAVKDVQAWHREHAQERRELERRGKQLFKDWKVTPRTQLEQERNRAYEETRNRAALLIPSIRLNFTTGMLIVSPPNPNCPKTYLDNDGDNLDMLAQFNPAYLADALALFPRKATIGISMADPLAACLITSPTYSDAKAVVMPERP